MKVQVEGDAFARMRWLGTAVFALLITALSLLLAAQAGVVLVGSKGLFGWLVAGVGVVAVLGAHLLLALGRGAAWIAKIGTVLIWMICMAYVVYGHASVFMAGQQTAANDREQAFDMAPARLAHLQSQPRRGEAAVLEDMASVAAGLARINVASCQDNCSVVKARWTHLKGREAALRAELKDIQRWNDQGKAWEARRSELTGDPVSTRFAHVTGLPLETMGLLTGLVFSLILEGTGCLCWYLVLDGRAYRSGALRHAPADVRHDVPRTSPGSHAVTAPATADVTAPEVERLLEPIDAVTAVATAVTTSEQGLGSPTVAAPTVTRDRLDDPIVTVTPTPEEHQVHGSTSDPWIESARSAVAAGEIRCTVAEIRRFLRCSQANARLVAEVLRAEERAQPTERLQPYGNAVPVI